MNRPEQDGEIVGFRTWTVAGMVSGTRTRLLSLNDVPWPHDDWMRATCETCDPADVPNPDCEDDRRARHGCGIHAARDPAQLVGLGYTDEGVLTYLWGRGDRPRVLGTVALAGKVIVGAKGWRAEKARPLKLWVPYEHWKVGNRLADAYGVTIELANFDRAAEVGMDGHR